MNVNDFRSSFSTSSSLHGGTPKLSRRVKLNRNYSLPSAVKGVSHIETIPKLTGCKFESRRRSRLGRDKKEYCCIKKIHRAYSQSTGAERILQRTSLIKTYEAYLEKHPVSKHIPDVLRTRYDLMLERSDSRATLLKNIKKSEVQYISWLAAEEFFDQSLASNAYAKQSVCLDEKAELLEYSKAINICFV